MEDDNPVSLETASAIEKTDKIKVTTQQTSLLLPPELLFVDSTPKFCVVCNDKALSCNFGAISCESCKAFFRRNAYKDGKMKVKCDGFCDVNVENRTKCKRCRLKKCIAQGMRKDLILSEEQKMERKRKIVLNKMKKSQSGSKDTSEYPSDKEDSIDQQTVSLKLANIKTSMECSAKKTKVLSHDLTRFEGKLEDPTVTSVKKSSKDTLSIQSHSELEKHNKTDQSSTQGDDKNVLSYLSVPSCSSSEDGENSPGSLHEELVMQTSNLASYFQMKDISIAELGGRHSAFVPAFHPALYGTCIDESVIEKLDPVVKQTISNMMTAYSVSFDKPMKENVRKTPSFTEVFNHCEIGIQIIVKMAKNLSSFAMFDQDDQITLLKGSIIDLLLIQAMRAFDDKNMRFVIPKCNLPIENNSGNNIPPSDVMSVLSLGTESHFKPLLQKYVDVFVKFKDTSKGHLSILMCSITLLLFTPRTSCQYKNYELVMHWYQIHLRTIRNLIEVAFPSSIVDVDEVINTMELIKGVSDLFKNTLQCCSPFDLAPLIAEVFDISV